MVLDSEGVPGDATSSSALRVLVQRNFGPYFLGNFVTSVGTWIQNIAMALLIFRLTGSTFLVAMVSFAQFIGLIHVAEDHRGRVMALWGVAFLGVRPAASLLDGTVATWVDLRAAAILMAVPVMVGAVYVARRARGAQP